MIFQIIAAFFATIFFSVLFNVSRYQLLYCGIVGAIGWFSYLCINDLTSTTIFSTFVSAIIISILSHIFARLRKHPVTVFQISGIIPLVPGAGMYRTLYYIVNENYELSTFHLYETLQIAGSIAVAMILISTMDKLVNKTYKVIH